MSFRIRLDRSSGRAAYRQIVEAVIGAIESGELGRGSRLPTVRALARDLGVTRVTIHNAYRKLQAEGWIDATVGRGSFVSGPPPARAVSLEPADVPLDADHVMAEINRFSHVAGTRSLAMAEPDPALYPAREFLRLLTATRPDREELFRYGPYQGLAELRQAMSDLLAQRSVPSRPESILVTSGATQALSLLTAALCQPGDTVLVENPTYLGFLGLAASYGVKPIGIPLDAEGPRLDALERAIVRERPRFFYTIPTFQNPTGTTQSATRRAALLSLAARYGVLIVEDDIYGDLFYGAAPPPPLKARDPEDRIAYVYSFSKALLPGIRTGLILPPAALREKLLSLLRLREMGSPPLMQRALAEFLDRGLFSEHLEKVLPIYERRRDALVAALERFLPADASWTHPAGGYCCWVSLPEGIDGPALYRDALARGLAYAPGEVFLTERAGGCHLRLCFGAREEGVLRESVRILGELVREHLDRPGSRKRSYAAEPVV